MDYETREWLIEFLVGLAGMVAMFAVLFVILWAFAQ